MRLLNSFKNMFTGTIYFFLSTILSFISRTIFIKILGQTYLGVNGLVSNVLSMLSLAELGIGTAINFSLYKPLAEKDNEKISSLMIFYKKAYAVIGVIVFIIGLLIISFSDYIIKDSHNIKDIKLILFLNILNVSLSYFMTYKIGLITADQKSYKLSNINCVFMFLSTISNIVILIITKSYILYIIVGMLISIIQRVFINRKIDKLYPILKIKTSNKLKLDDLNEIKVNVRALILHRIGDFFIHGSDNLIISAFINIKLVGVYSNYTMLISMINKFIMIFFNSITASMGNFITIEKDYDRRISVFNTINFVSFWMYCVTSICILNLLNPFIEIWIGESFLLNNNTLILIVLNYYLTGMRIPIAVVNSAAGIYDKDKYVSFAHAILNLLISILLVERLGIFGVLLGTFFSGILTSAWIKPYICYKYILNAPFKFYLKSYMLNFSIMIFTNLLTCIIIRFLKISSSNLLLDFILQAISYFMICNIILFIIFRKNVNLEYLKQRILKFGKER